MTKQVSQLSHQQDFRPHTSSAGRAFRPLKRLGQHFLRQKSVLAKIIEAADLKKSDLVVEIGPGLGVLTEKLAQKAGRVIAIEKDSRLIPLLNKRFKNVKNIKIVERDILDILKNKRRQKLEAGISSNFYLPTSNFKVVANLPYYAATHIIRQFLESPCPPKLMVVMLQKEVAQRIAAKPPQMTRSTDSGSSRAGRGMTLLGISVQFYAKAEIVASVPKTAFWPAPKVDSAILRIAPLIYADKRLNYADRFFEIAKAGFSQPRKTLLNNLSAKLNLSKNEVEKQLTAAGINLKARPGELSLKNWFFLAKTLVVRS